VKVVWSTLVVLFILSGSVVAAELSQPLQQAPAPPPQEGRGIWAAIAYSQVDQKHGFFWGAPKRQQAMNLAVDHCRRAGGEACTVVEVFRNHRHWHDEDKTGLPYHPCGALAVGENRGSQVTSWAAKSAVTRREAERNALEACEAPGGKCKVREWVCT
jgi:hypothetical protein